MNKNLIVLGIAILLICVGLCGCVTRKTLVSEGDVNFSIEDVVITSELEIEEFFTNTTKTEVSNDTAYVIVSISVHNMEDDWLTVQTAMQSLTDDEGNKYDGKMFVKFDDSTYTIEQLILINEENALGWSSDVAPNSTQVKKAVFELPLGKNPNSIYISYGFKPNELANVERWYHITLDIPIE